MRRYGFWSIAHLDHVDFDLEAEQAAGKRQRRAPLAGAGLGGETLDAFLLVVVGLRHRGVRLVAAGGADALILEVDVRRGIERLLQAVRADQRRRPPQPIDVAHLFGNLDPPLGRDLLHDDLHREQRRQVVRPDRLSRFPDAARAAAATADRPRCCTRLSGSDPRRAHIFSYSSLYCRPLFPRARDAARPRIGRIMLHVKENSIPRSAANVDFRPKTSAGTENANPAPAKLPMPELVFPLDCGHSSRQRPCSSALHLPWASNRYRRSVANP